MNIKVHVLHCGRVKVDRAIPFHERTLHPAPYTGFLRGESKKSWIPVSAYLIEHPKGPVLIDTGWHTDVRKDPKKYLGFLHYSISRPDLPDGQAITEQLERLGYRAEDIDYLVLSHLHSDHASGMQLMKNARKILVSEQEWKKGNSDRLTYKPFMWEGLNVETFRFEPSIYGPEQRAFDIFNDGTVLFISTPGHTTGMASTLVQNKGRFVLLCSDTGYAKKSWEELILPGMVANKKKAFTSLSWVKMMSALPGCIDVIANHDSDVIPCVIEL